MKTRSVQEWFQLIQTMDDSKLVVELLGNLQSYQGLYGKDREQVLALFTAIRLDQMAKEVGAMFEPKKET